MAGDLSDKNKKVKATIAECLPGGYSNVEKAKALAKDIQIRLDPDHIEGLASLLVVLESSLENVKKIMNDKKLP